MITEHSYWMDRDTRYRLEWTNEIQENGRRIVVAINSLLLIAEADTDESWNEMSSGWRPKSVNAKVKNASPLSNHLTAHAGDVLDPDRILAQWCVNHPDKLAECGLWMEDPRWTPTWVHLQDVPPKSGKRIYVPNTKPPLAPALEGQKPIPAFIRT